MLLVLRISAILFNHMMKMFNFTFSYLPCSAKYKALQFSADGLKIIQRLTEVTISKFAEVFIDWSMYLAVVFTDKARYVFRTQSKISTLDVWHGSEYASESYQEVISKISALTKCLREISLWTKLQVPVSQFTKTREVFKYKYTYK